MIQELRKIGNSAGIIIPKKILDSCHIKDEVELKVVNEILIVKSVKSRPREGWDVAFKMAIKKHGTDKDMFEGIENEFDNE